MMRTGTPAREYVRRPLSPFATIGMAALSLVVIAGSTGCDRAIIDAATGQEVQPWQDPFDYAAVKMAMPYYLPVDLSTYNFSTLFFVQNYNNTGFAVTLEVNGQDIERRYVAAKTQEVFEITEATVLETEAALGLSSTTTEPRLQGHPCPFVVRLKDYVTEDGYIVQNTDFLMAPVNIFESMSKAVWAAQVAADAPEGVSGANPDTSFVIDGHLAAPAVFALVVRQTHVDVVELDREFLGVNEEGDDADIVYTSLSPIDFNYHQQTIDALNLLGLNWLLDGR